MVAFLKRKGIGYQSEKSKIFIREQLDVFVNEAPDEKYANPLYYDALRVPRRADKWH